VKVFTAGQYSSYRESSRTINFTLLTCNCNLSHFTSLITSAHQTAKRCISSGLTGRGADVMSRYHPLLQTFSLVAGFPVNGKLPLRGFIYTVYTPKRSAIKQRIAIKRSATSATQLLFPLQIVMFKRRTAVSGAWNWKPRHSA